MTRNRDLSPCTALVTGASSGIGLEFARQLAAWGAALVMVSIARDDLDRESARIATDYRVPVETLCMDLARPEAADELYQYCREKGLEKRVHLLHGVSFDDLPALYRLAELFVYPSRFEGFGIPIIEALHAGVPVIAATGSCLEEAGGEDSCYIHPDDVEGLAQTACSLLQTPETCERMIRQGKEYVQRFSEKEQACQLMNLYRALMK